MLTESFNIPSIGNLMWQESSVCLSIMRSKLWSTEKEATYSSWARLRPPYPPMSLNHGSSLSPQKFPSTVRDKNSLHQYHAEPHILSKPSFLWVIIISTIVTCNNIHSVVDVYMVTQSFHCRHPLNQLGQSTYCGHVTYSFFHTHLC